MLRPVTKVQRLIIPVVLCLLAFLGNGASSEEIRLEPTRDTWLSAVGDEAHGANGGASRLKFKSIQELSLIDFDFQSLRGKSIEKGSLFLKQASDVPLDRMTVSTLATDWIEGTGSNYQIANGQSTFSHRKYPDERWGDSDVTAVSLGAGSTLWNSIEPVRLPEGWYRYDVPIELIEACVAGLSPGWLLMDDTGSTWKRDGESFEYQLFPNRFAFSKDSNRASMPYLIVELAPKNPSSIKKIPPPEKFNWVPSNIQDKDSRAKFRWRLPTYDSYSPVIGFRLKSDNKLVEQYFMPRVNRGSTDFEFVVYPGYPPWDLENPHRLELRAIGRNGEESEPAYLDIPSWKSKTLEAPWPIEAIAPDPATKQANLSWDGCPKLNDMHIAIIDPLDQILPDRTERERNEIVPPNRVDYLAKNILWNAIQRSVHLRSCRGAWVGFQLVVEKPEPNVELAIELSGVPGLRIETYRYEYVAEDKGLIADPLIPVVASGTSTKRIPLEPSSKTRSIGSWLVEFYLPQDIKPGRYQGTLNLRHQQASLELNLEIDVNGAVIPNELSFLPEMNCYDLPSNDIDYYRLANRHRVVLNRVPYYQNGKVAEGMTPLGSPGQWDWTEWDKRFGSLFTGQAFADLPRGKTPIECFYFPMHENWPAPMDGNYLGSYWAEEAFPKSYRDAWKQTSLDFIAHAHEHQWLATRFQVFLNNKVDFKKRGWSRGSSPWLLDEPANFQDYAALRYFGQIFHEAFEESPKGVNVLFRCDISRPQWQRDTLDGLMKYNVVSQSAFREYHRLVIDRKLKNDQTVMVYGSANPIGTNNIQSVAWSWDTWMKGGDGVLPWQTIGNRESWLKADELALFYPHPEGGQLPPVPSIRLKAFCYAQQDIELLKQEFERRQMDRYHGGQIMSGKTLFQSESRMDSRVAEDAGWVDYGSITPETIEVVRRALLSMAR